VAVGNHVAIYDATYLITDGAAQWKSMMEHCFLEKPNLKPGTVREPGALSQRRTLARATFL